MVEWKKLGEVCEIKGRIGFRGYTRNDQVEKGEGAISISPGNISDSILTFDSCTFITWAKYEESPEIKVHKGDIVLCKTASVGKVAMVYNLPEKATINPQLVLIKNIIPSLSAKMLFYYLNDYRFQQKIKALAGIGSVPNVSQAKLSEILIPIPSLSEQNRIVGILDTFTNSIENLKQQIAQRRKQYEFYRDHLLDLEGKEGVELTKLGEIAYYSKDRISALMLNAKNYVSVENLLKDKAGRNDSEKVPESGNWVGYKENDILIGNIRPYLRKIWLADRNGGTNGDVLVIRPKKEITFKFLYFVLSSEIFFDYYNMTAKGGKMPRGDKKRALSYPIFLPTLSEQQRIVSILNTFEASISNLEAQLAQRQKQYEYYRNKLLTFE